MFLNISRDILGIGPWDGETRQVSSFGRRARRLPGLIGEFQEKCVDLEPGEDHVAADLEGPGLITRIWVTVPRRMNPGVLDGVTVSIYFDEEDTPSVQSPLGDFFGATFGVPRDYYSAYLSITSGAYNCLFPMPFARRARVVFSCGTRLGTRVFFYQVTYLALRDELPPDTPYFHCRWDRRVMERNGPPFRIMEASGTGIYLGCHLNMEGRGWPWRPNPVHVQMPEGFGLGILEGWERIRIDGAPEPQVQGTGGEDYFNGAWYFTRVPSAHLGHGVTLRSYASRRVSCYRFHLEMPVSFRESIEVTLDHGINNRLPAAVDGCAYWYQREPHRPFGPLPPAGERRRGHGLVNRLIMAAPVSAAALLCYLRHSRKGRGPGL